jgi:hypothetical protein
MSRSLMWTRHAPAGRLVNVTRIAWGVFFLGSAVFNALITTPNAAQVYLSFAGMSWPVAEQLVRRLVVPVGMAFTLLVAAFEITVGLLILRRRTARVGIGISLGWLAVLIPFLDGYGLVNIVLIAALLPLLRYDYDNISPGHIGVRRRR